jgi:hypothetical protein
LLPVSYSLIHIVIEKIEETKGVIRSRKSKKCRINSGKNRNKCKKTQLKTKQNNSDLQNCQTHLSCLFSSCVPCVVVSFSYCYFFFSFFLYTLCCHFFWVNQFWCLRVRVCVCVCVEKIEETKGVIRSRKSKKCRINSGKNRNKCKKTQIKFNNSTER